MRAYRWLVSAVLWMVVTAAGAGTVTIDFDDVPLGENTANFTRSGFRFSPNCHLDGMNSFGPVTSTVVGWDLSGCQTLNNPDYLGSHLGTQNFGNGGLLYIDFSGGRFDFVSVVEWLYAGGGGTFYSSRGGVATPMDLSVDEFREHTFDGAEWRNLEWVVILGGRGAPDFWIDSMTLVGLPEPASALLALAALVAAGAVRRRPQAATRPQCSEP